MGKTIYQLLVLSFFLSLQGCVSQQTLTAEYLKGPVVSVPAKLLAKDQPQACAKIEPFHVVAKNYSTVAQEAGILPDDFLSLQKSASQLHLIFTFRDANQSCEPHLRAGMESKAHDVLTKTFTIENLPPEYKYLAGTVSLLPRRLKPGEKIQDPLSKRYLSKDGKPLTCDYDLMDVALANGQRVEGESAFDLQFRDKLNETLPLRGQPPHPVKRIMHGAQAEYSNYLRSVAKKGAPEEPIITLNKPESPITAFTENGEVYRLQHLEDVFNFYYCHNIVIPAEWNIQY